MIENLNYIQENIENIRMRLENAALRSRRRPEDIKIIAVTKTVDVEKIMKAIECGLTDLGENRVQELCEKYEALPDYCSWHLIGHLQTNKVKYIVDKVKMIHSLDSLELAQEIQKRSEKAQKIIDVLVQVNVSGEETKFGIRPEDVEPFLKSLSKLGNIRVKGLMTIAPFSDNAEDTRNVFRGLRKIFIDISKKYIDNINMEYLSMGMSNDFEIAIEEGSNMVRIGTRIFGSRNK